MAQRLHSAPRMTKAALVLALLAVPLTARAQPTDPPDGAIVASAQVSGFDLGRLSPGLQEDIARLAGGPLDRARLNELAARIEEEQPRYVAAVRVVSVPAGEVRVVFVVAHMRDQDRRGDANARYLIERVEIRGISESDVAADLNAEVQTLVGKPLGSEDVDQVEAKVRTAFPDYDVSRRVIRGSRTGEIRLLFILEQEGIGAMAALHADEIQVCSITPIRDGAPSWTSPSAAATSASPQSSRSTMVMN